MDMHDRAMPGGWTMSMAWMLGPGQTWAGAGAAFVGMWTPMMIAMMLPSLAPPLWRCRRALRASGALRREIRVALAATGYFAVWILVGVVVFPVGATIAAAAMRFPALARAAPVAAAIVVVVAGVLQLTAWKSRRLACCRAAFASARAAPSGAVDAWRGGVRVGVDCVTCCSGLTAILLVAGVMDLRAMIAVTAAITLERVAPRAERVARMIGGLAILAGLLLLLA